MNTVEVTGNVIVGNRVGISANANNQVDLDRNNLWENTVDYGGMNHGQQT